jgi:autotransporter-associated beta strand protein
MKFKQLLLLVLFFTFCISLNVFADDLKIEDGKIVKYGFEGYNTYDDQQVYDNITIGAGTKVVLDSQWQYMFLSSNTTTTYSEGVMYDTTTVPVSSYSVINSQEDTVYQYRNDEVIATLSISDTGTLTLNSGSALSLRNQYSLITSTQDVSLEYAVVGKDEDGKDIIALVDESNSNMRYDSGSYSDCTTYNGSVNRNLLGTVDTFSGDIVFGEGIEDTVLTFQATASSSAKLNGTLPTAKESETVSGKGVTGTTTLVDTVEDVSVGKPTYDYAEFANNFQVNSNSAVFNVLSDEVFLYGDITGNGTVVKSGTGILTLLGDSTGLQGTNTGYSWSIKEGMLNVYQQQNLGTGSISLESSGTLGLGSIISSGYQVYTNDVTSQGGIISLSSSHDYELSGDITGEAVVFSLGGTTNLSLTGSNTVNDFVISFTGADNVVEVDSDSLSSQSITANNITEDDSLKEFANLTLTISQSTDNEYSGSLNGEMYLRKTGNGILTLSGTNTYTQGTYISQGGVLMTNASSLGSGKIMFDSGVRGSSSTYASLGVSSSTVGTIELLNNIHIDKGAIFNVYENQSMSLYGDVIRYNTMAGNEAEFIKTGLGLLEIAKSSSTTRKVNISSFTVEEGGFNLDENVVLDSYFSLNSDSAYLSMEKGAGVKNAIDVNAGDLIIFNQSNIADASVNFNSTSTVNLSQLVPSSNTVLSTTTLNNRISVAKGIDFVTESTTTANLNAFNFLSPTDSIIKKSGEGNLNFNTNGVNFNISNLSVNDGYFNLVANSSMTVSSTTVVDGGILSFEQGSYFQSSASGVDEKIVVSSGGIKIYDDNNIESSTLLSFEGTDKNNLAKLIVVADNVNLTNSIFVKTGVIVENQNSLTISGDSINYDSAASGIFGKSGAGTMTIAQTSGGAGFNMGELAVIEGLMNITTDVNVSTSVVTGNTSSMYVNSSTMTVVNDFNLFNYDEMKILSAKLNVGNDLALSSGSFTVNNSTVSVSNVLDSNNMAAFDVVKSSVTASSLGIADMSSSVNISSSNVFVSSAAVFSNLTGVNISDSGLTVGSNFDLSYSTSSLSLSSLSVGKNMIFDASSVSMSTASINVSSSAYLTNVNLAMSSSSISADYMSVYNSTITLRNNSVLVSAVDLNNAAILKGFGSVNGSLNVKSNAAVSIGETASQLGQMSVNSARFNAGSTLYIDVKSSNSATSNDKLAVNGNLVVEDGVTLNVNITGDNSEFARKKSFEIITYTGVLDPLNAAIFSNIELSSARLKADVQSTGSSVILNIFQRWTNYSLPGASVNQQGMMDALNNIYADSEASVILAATLAKTDELYGDYQDTGDSTAFAAALTDLSGLMYANSFESSILLANSKAGLIYNRLADFESRPQNNIWAQAYTNTHSIAKNGGNSKFENAVTGLIAGFDTFTNQDFVMGISGFYGSGQFKQSEDKADIDEAGVNAYAYYQYDDIEIKGLIGYGVQDYEATRKLRFISQEVKSKYAVNTLSFDMEASYKYSINNEIVLKPLMGLNCTVASNNDIVEDGNLEQKLKIDAGSYTKADFRIGLGLQSNNSSKFNWYVSAVAKQVVDGDKLTMTASFAEVTDEKFEIESTKLSDTVFSGNIGGVYSLTKDVDLFIDLSTDTSSSTNMLSGNVGASYKW